VHRALHRRSEVLGIAQTSGCLGLILLTAARGLPSGFFGPSWGRLSASLRTFWPSRAGSTTRNSLRATPGTTAANHNLPECPDGIAASWCGIAGILHRQEADPGYQHTVEVPGRSASAATRPA
jgi:hypothetical protein